MASRAIKTEPEEVESVHQICRLCMSQESLDDVFTEKGVCQWILDYLSITITAEDNMSHSICSICRIRLTEFHQFRVRSQEVQDMLQSTLCSTTSTKEMEMVRGSVELEQLSQPISQDEHLEDENNKEQELEIKETDQKRRMADKLKDIKLEPYEEVDSTLGTHEHVVEQMPRTESEQYNSKESEEDFSIHLKPSSLNLPYNISLKEENESDTNIHYESADDVTEDMIDIEEVKIERVHEETSEEEQSGYTEDMDSISTHNANPSSSSQTTDRAVPIAIEMHGTEQIQCKICLEIFPDKMRFRNHKYKHRKTILCSICEKPFSNRARMQTHMRTHLSIKERKRVEKPFKCEICEKSFLSSYVLKGHLQQVHGPKTHQCTICGLQFSRRNSLMSHVQIHSLRGDSEQDYQTFQLEPKEETDGRDTNNDASKDAALGEKKFKCGECQEAFQKEIGLFRHFQLVHRKKFKCSLCNAEFGGNKFLERHILNVHKPKEARQLKEKPFKCDTCSRAFMRKRHLVAHQKQVHGPKSFECHRCDSKYGTLGDLNRHLRMKHRDSTMDYQTLQKLLTERMCANPEAHINEKETNNKSLEVPTHCSNRN